MIKIIKTQNINSITNNIELIISSILKKKSKYSQVIIKPAIGSCLASSTGATIDLNLLDIIIKILLKKGIKPIVIESPSHIHDFDKTMEMLGVKSLCKKYRVDLLNPLKEKKDLIYIAGIGLTRIPSIMNQRIPIIGIAKSKTHDQAGLSLGIKNLIGILPIYGRHKMHLKGLTRGLIGLYERFKNDFIISIIDGIIGMEGNGPTKGIPINSNFVAIGNNLLLTDIEIMVGLGFAANEVPYLEKLIKKYGINIKSNKREIINYEKPKKSKGIKAIIITFPVITYLFKKIIAFSRFLKS